jgi:hypothetical protein
MPLALTHAGAVRPMALLRLLGVAIAVVGFFALANSALAATASMSVDSSGAVHVLYQADPGEKNDVTVSDTPCPSGKVCVSSWDWVDISDPGATTLNAVWGASGANALPSGCTNLNATTVRCRYPANPQGHVIRDVTLDLADRDDDAFVDDAAWAYRTTIRGGSGDDDLFGGRACDTLEGGGNKDTLDGGPGADVLNGGSGWDTADYGSRTEKILVSLDGVPNDGKETGSGVTCNGTPTSPSATEGDNVLATENVDGGSGNDRLVGNSGPNRLYGGPGHDELDGKLGADDLYGGDGWDTVSYGGRTADLSVTIGGTGGEANEGDFVRADVEGVWGSAGNDQLVGNNADNDLVGSGGNDTLDGGDGNDALRGGPHDDTLNGGAGADVLLGGVVIDGGEDPRGPGDVDNDTLNGGAGADRLFGEYGDDQIDARDSTLADAVDCGPGSDSTLADFTRNPLTGWLYESVVDCETVSWTRVAPTVDTGSEPSISPP